MARRTINPDAAALPLIADADECAGNTRAALDEAIKKHEPGTRAWKECITNARHWLARMEGVELALDVLEETDK